MATNFRYAGVSDLTKYFNRVNDFNSKIQIFPTETSGDNHFFRNSGYVTRLFINGSEQGNPEADFSSVNSDGKWCYNLEQNDVKFQHSGYSSVTVNEQIFEAGVDFEDFIKQSLVDASLELHNYLDARYSTPIEKAKQVDIDTNPSAIGEEYDPIIIKATCYIAAANLIRAKEGVSEEADYYHSLVTNSERTGLIDKLNDGIYKLSNEVDDKDKNGKVLARTVAGSMDIVELGGQYFGEPYDMLKVEVLTTGAYGVATFKVHYYHNDKLEGTSTESEIITGGLQALHGGLTARFQGLQANDGDIWYVEVYGSHRKQTNKSNASIDLVR